MIKSYYRDSKKLYEVFVKSKDQTGKQVARRKRNITSERKAKDIELQFKIELKSLSSQTPIWTFEKWHEECLKRMQYNKALSTLMSYEGQIKKWLPKLFMGLDISKITKANVYDLIFKDISVEVTPCTRKALLKMIKRLFEMAVEEGLISTNPAKGLMVKLPPPEQKVLTSEEAQVLLRAAKETNHPFYPVWAFALMTRMRSGELVLK